MIMDRTKSRANIVDGSALAKSAAWAWFQHGSNTDDGQSLEFYALRTKIQPKPSRYKLEAFKHEQKSAPHSLSIKLATQTRPSSNRPLLDNYEIERISRQLQYYIESSRAAVEAVTTKDKIVEKKKIPKGFWRLRYVPACGSSIGDVVGGRGVKYSRQPEKRRVRGRGTSGHNQLNVVHP